VGTNVGTSAVNAQFYNQYSDVVMLLAERVGFELAVRQKNLRL